MKRQELTSALLKLKKINIVNLNYIKDGNANVTSKLNCCSNPNICHTITTKPDSLKNKQTTTISPNKSLRDFIKRTLL